ncbi:hypothetical protein ScPMuIL_000664 [Solemya velum]
MIQMIKQLDSALGYLKERLAKFDLLHKMNVIITADHGMTMFVGKTINIDTILDPKLYDLWNGELSYQLPQIQPKPGLEDEVFRKLENQPNFYTYRKGFPKLKALHYSESNRIPEIILEAKKGWVFIKNDSSPTGYLKGMHGYDPAKVPDMYPFFIASGPAFKRGVVVEPFDMVDIYPLMCHVLGLTPAPNNGSLRNVKSFLVKPPADEGSFEATAATSTLQFRDPIVVITISGWRKLVGQLWVYRETTVGIRGSRSQVTDNFLTGETTALPQVIRKFFTRETTAHHKSLNFFTDETTALSQLIDIFLTGETIANLKSLITFSQRKQLPTTSHSIFSQGRPLPYHKSLTTFSQGRQLPYYKSSASFSQGSSRSLLCQLALSVS